MEGLNIEKIVAEAVARIEEQDEVEISYRMVKRDKGKGKDQEAAV